MPPACPVVGYARRYRRPASWRECHRLARWIVTLVATAGLALLARMPPARPVDAYARRYRRPRSPRANATGLPGGCLRSSLPPARSPRPNATGLPGGCLRSSLPPARSPARMPPACPVDAYARRYRRPRSSRPNATGLPGGLLRSSLPPARLHIDPCAVDQPDKAAWTACAPDAILPNDSQRPHAAVAANVSIHRASRWHSDGVQGRRVAVSVSHHRASRWHSGAVGGCRAAMGKLEAVNYFFPCKVI